MPSLHTRKIIALDRALVVQLPTAWCRYYGLKKGAELEMVANHRITIKPKLKPATDEQTAHYPDSK